MLLSKIKKIPKNTNERTVGYPSTSWASCLNWQRVLDDRSEAGSSGPRYDVLYGVGYVQHSQL